MNRVVCVHRRDSVKCLHKEGSGRYSVLCVSVVDEREAKGEYSVCVEKEMVWYMYVYVYIWRREEIL